MYIDLETRRKTMTLDTDEFIRRFLLHVLPRGFHRIRHYGWLANGSRVAKLVLARELLQMKPTRASGDEPQEQAALTTPWTCPTCAAPMIIIATFERGYLTRAPPTKSKV
jgi:hypothetical protein